MDTKGSRPVHVSDAPERVCLFIDAILFVSFVTFVSNYIRDRETYA